MKSIQRFFEAADLAHQQVYETVYWRVVMPGTPVSPHHLLFIVKAMGKYNFTDLSHEEVSDLKDCIAHITLAYEGKYEDVFDGYNLFSNNGSVRVGKHIQNFHQHIFLRLTDETESPYDVMNRRESWSQSGSEEWFAQRDSLIELFKA